MMVKGPWSDTCSEQVNADKLLKQVKSAILKSLKKSLILKPIYWSSIFAVRSLLLLLCCV